MAPASSPTSASAPAPALASLPADPARAVRTYCLCLAAACGLTIAWFFFYSFAYGGGLLVDEPGHLNDVHHFNENRPGWPADMTMLPGYHYVIVTLWKLHPPCELPTLMRFVTTLFALGGLGVFAWAWRRVHANATLDAAGWATLLLALMPVLQPFSGMAYTDWPALTWILAGFAAHWASRPALSTLLFAIAAVFRQTNLLWPAFLIACDLFDPAVSRREFVRRHVGHAVLLLIAAAVVLKVGRLTLGNQIGAKAEFNIATVHTGALLVLLLGLPVWLAHLPALGRRALAMPGRAVAIAVGLGALAAVFAYTFKNPHVWNRDLYWPPDKFTLLRNWPLVYIDKHAWLRAASGLNIVLMAGALALVIARQPHRRALWLSLPFGAALPAANNLVEPRYFIPAIAFVLLFLEIPRPDTRRLAIWWALLCAIHAPFVALRLSLW